MNLAKVMLAYSAARKQEQSIIMPHLRRQIAGNFENPYDLNNYENRDLKLFCQEYFHFYNKRPSSIEIEDIALFPAEENLLQLQTFLSKL